MAPKDEADEELGQWRPGDRVSAVWAGNGCYYAATVVQVDEPRHILTVTWDDADMSHREVPFAQVMQSTDDTKAWTKARIDKCSSVKETPGKGRCLFTKSACEPGQVVFVEEPMLVTVPSLAPKLWAHLNQLHEDQPLNLGTITFHFAALMSQVLLEPMSIDIILDKFVPNADEEPGDDVIRIIESLNSFGVEEQQEDGIKLDVHAMDLRRLQKLVSAWRYNSFGHHKEDGLVLYNRISMCAHSCDPSCCWSYGDDDAFVMRARFALHEGDELTISYLQDEDLLKSTLVRQEKLQNWCFTCQCERCILQVDMGRGFRCRKCRTGIVYANASGTLEPCHMCSAPVPKEDVTMLLQLEEEYQQRVESLDKTDVADVEAVYEAALEIFDRHWIMYVMDTMLWEAYKEDQLHDAVEHQRLRILFHEHYYCRPTFIFAWSHEELGDAVQSLYPHRKWQQGQAFQRAHQMLAILCGSSHQYTGSPYNKLNQLGGNWAASDPTI